MQWKMTTTSTSRVFYDYQGHGHDVAALSVLVDNHATNGNNTRSRNTRTGQESLSRRVFHIPEDNNDNDVTESHLSQIQAYTARQRLQLEARLNARLEAVRRDSLIGHTPLVLRSSSNNNNNNSNTNVIRRQQVVQRPNSSSNSNNNSSSSSSISSQPLRSGGNPSATSTIIKSGSNLIRGTSTSSINTNNNINNNCSQTSAASRRVQRAIQESLQSFGGLSFDSLIVPVSSSSPTGQRRNNGDPISRSSISSDISTDRDASQGETAARRTSVSGHRRRSQAIQPDYSDWGGSLEEVLSSSNNRNRNRHQQNNNIDNQRTSIDAHEQQRRQQQQQHRQSSSSLSPPPNNQPSRRRRDDFNYDYFDEDMLLRPARPAPVFVEDHSWDFPPRAFESNYTTTTARMRSSRLQRANADAGSASGASSSSSSSIRFGDGGGAYLDPRDYVDDTNTDFFSYENLMTLHERELERRQRELTRRIRAELEEHDQQWESTFKNRNGSDAIKRVFRCVKYKPTTSGADVVEEKDSCSICLEDFTAGMLLHKLPCDHLFHKDCIGNWVKSNPSCPNCRKSLLL